MDGEAGARPWVTDQTLVSRLEARFSIRFRNICVYWNTSPAGTREMLELLPRKR